MKFSVKNGFTIVEMIIVVVVIGLLAGLSTVGYKGVQVRASNTAMMADAVKVEEQLELAFSKANKFPDDLDSLEIKRTDPTVNFDYTPSPTGLSYCLAIFSTNSSANAYTVRDNKKISEGDCSTWTPNETVAKGPDSPVAPPASPPVAPTPSFSSLATNELGVSWSNVSGATSYQVRYGTSSPTTVASCSSSTCTISGLNMNTTYYVNVTAINANGSAASSTINAMTRIPAPATASVTYTKSTYKAQLDTYRRYSVTASGGACSVGSTEWQINVSAVGYRSTWTWASSNTKVVDINERGQYSPDDVTIYAKPRCVSGTNITNGNTAAAISGSGGAAY